MVERNKSWLNAIKNFKHKEIIIFSLIMFIVYLSTMGCSLDDQDSIFFLRGIKEFNVSKYQPHPPGYPVYIFLGKISHFLINDDLLSLTVLSAIAGFLSLIVFYFLIYEMYSKKIALMSTVLMSITTLFWLNSLKAMSDMTGLFFALLSIYFIYCFIKYKKNKTLYFASFISAIAIGVRFHMLFVLLPLLIYCYFKAKNKKVIAYSILLFFIGVLVWLIPTIYCSGLEGYFNQASELFFRRYNKSDLKEHMFSFWLSRFESFFNLISWGYGINPLKGDLSFYIPFVIYLSFILLSYEKTINKKNLFFVIGLVPYFLMYFFILLSNNTRYLLIFIPFVSLLLVLGTFWFGKYQFVAFTALCVLTLIISLPLALQINNTPSPIVQAISYIKSNYDLNETYIYNEPILNQHITYYGLKDYRDNNNKTLLYVSSIKYPPENTNLTLIESFKRDWRIHVKHNRVYLYEINNLTFIYDLEQAKK